ncbi:MAG: hypothetical protein RML95_12895 [Anaerolineae bacterium]|nr:hypothetical protein [Anaerolineae bacterium]MDW8300223.1 hypothetical protein [Anaerolineae bacterium]
MWVVVAAAVAVTLSVAFWQQIVNWANRTLAEWLGKLFGDDVREAFVLLLAAADRLSVAVRRALNAVQERLLHAQIIFRRLNEGRLHEKVLRAEFQREDGQVVQMEAAEVVPWHELPDEVREKFIRRQSAEVQIELRLKE